VLVRSLVVRSVTLEHQVHDVLGDLSRSGRHRHGEHDRETRSESAH
jgi:hypothetical protein